MAQEPERSNIHILEVAETDNNTGGGVTYMHLHTQMVMRRCIPHSCASAEKTGCAVTYKKPHQHINLPVDI